MQKSLATICKFNLHSMYTTYIKIYSTILENHSFLMDSSPGPILQQPTQLTEKPRMQGDRAWSSLSAEHHAECDLRALLPRLLLPLAPYCLRADTSLLGRESESRGAACCGSTSRGRSSLLFFIPDR